MGKYCTTWYKEISITSSSLKEIIAIVRCKHMCQEHNSSYLLFISVHYLPLNRQFVATSHFKENIIGLIFQVQIVLANSIVIICFYTCDIL